MNKTILRYVGSVTIFTLCASEFDIIWPPIIYCQILPQSPLLTLTIHVIVTWISDYRGILLFLSMALLSQPWSSGIPCLITLKLSITSMYSRVGWKSSSLLDTSDLVGFSQASFFHTLFCPIHSVFCFFTNRIMMEIFIWGHMRKQVSGLLRTILRRNGVQFKYCNFIFVLVEFGLLI